VVRALRTRQLPEHGSRAACRIGGIWVASLRGDCPRCRRPP
jgi:hypothetical protein